MTDIFLLNSFKFFERIFKSSIYFGYTVLRLWTVMRHRFSRLYNIIGGSPNSFKIKEITQTSYLVRYYEDFDKLYLPRS